MATKITEDQKIQINILYKKLKTYAAVAREVGCSPSTVKRYVVADFVDPEEVNKNITQVKQLPPINLDIFNKPFGDLCLLTAAEKAEMQDLWKEMVL